jgi:hypothetical protein
VKSFRSANHDAAGAKALSPHSQGTGFRGTAGSAIAADLPHVVSRQQNVSENGRAGIDVDQPHDRGSALNGFTAVRLLVASA